MSSDAEARAHGAPIRFGLRPRMLGALLLTAIVTLGAAALALLAPLQSTLRSDTVKIGQIQVQGYKTGLGFLPVGRRGLPQGIQHQVEILFHLKGPTFVVWDDHLRLIADSDLDTRDKTAPAPVRQALDNPNLTPYTLSNGVLVVASRYRGQPAPGAPRGRLFVLEMIRHVDYLGPANSVVANAFLTAALAGLAVALVLGFALSSRLLRRLRLLRDATRSTDERGLSTLVVPSERVSDEIGELAQAFETMHARIRQQEDARRAFVATASHELRTPLTSLNGMLELLADDLAREPVDVEDARTRVAQAQLQSRRLASLAADLLDLSRIDAQVPLRSEPVELGETARAVTAEFDQRAQEREIAVVLDQVGEAAWAQADPASVARIVRILLDNALAAAPAHSMIEVRVRNGTGPQMIEVADEGPGVPEQERELIFERFKRGSGRGSEGGFGLGLAIGTELATRMGGTLALDPGGERHGATFRLTLPKADG